MKLLTGLMGLKISATLTPQQLMLGKIDIDKVLF